MSEVVRITGTATIRVNGEDRQLETETLRALLDAEAVDPQSVNLQSVNSGARGLAVAVNGAVVPRHAWDTTRLAPGDEVEIVKLFAGG
jgi:sulfur carrier protein